MKDIIKVCKFIAYDKEAIRKKPIQKLKHGNQHTVCKQGNPKEWKHQKFVFRLVIPHRLTDFLKFRIQEDIMLASGEYQSNSLGKLSVHPISNQYRVIRIDKRKRLLSTSVEAYDLPIIPLENIVRMVFTKNPSFAHLLQIWGIQLLSQFDRELLSTKEDIDSLTSVTSPFDCLISKLVNKEIVTTQRIFNFSFLEMMGITERMYRTYVSETGQQPNPVFYDQSDIFFQKFGEWASTWQEGKQHPVELINYQGQRFLAQCTFKTMFIRCNVQNAIYRCCFWIYEPEDYQNHPRSSRINECHYFKEINKLNQQSIANQNRQIANPLLRCGVRELMKTEN